MMFVLRASPRYSPAATRPLDSGGGAIRTVTAPIVSGALAERVDVVGEQPRMPAQDLGQSALSTAAIQRVDRAVALGRCAPVVVARAR